MAFLTLNGVTVSVSVEGASLAYARVGGEQERSPGGDLEGGSLADKREWNLSTTPVPASEVDAWVGLIEGKGHSFPLDADLYSARGRGAASGTGTIVTSAPKWGAGDLRLVVEEVTWAVGFGSAWTLMFWGRDADNTTWRHLVLRSDGEEWSDGVVTPGAVTGRGDCGAVLSLGDPVDALGMAWIEYDDVVALPYAVPDAWVASLYAQHSAAAWSSLPRISAAGSFYPSSLTVRGKVTESRVIRCHLNGALTTGYTLEFTLKEV